MSVAFKDRKRRKIWTWTTRNAEHGEKREGGEARIEVSGGERRVIDSWSFTPLPMAMEAAARRS